MFDDEILSLLRCPETGQELRVASETELAGFPGGSPEGGLLTLDGSRLYPVRNGLPHLVVDEALLKVEDRAAN